MLLGWLSACTPRLRHQSEPTPPSFRTEQADFFSPPRSCELVGLRREKSLYLFEPSVAFAFKMKKAGFEPRGSSLVSPKEAKASEKPYGKALARTKTLARYTFGLRQILSAKRTLLFTAGWFRGSPSSPHKWQSARSLPRLVQLEEGITGRTLFQFS